MRICFVLPGPSRHPIGGYKVVYQYANLFARRGEDVTIVHAALHQGGMWGRGRDARTVYGFARGVVARSRPTWYSLDAPVRSRVVGFARPRTIPPAEVVVATSVRTAPLVAQVAAMRGVAGAYFIQGLESWDAPTHVLEDTWRLPLAKVVIAPWLADVGETLGVDTTVVSNAIDLDRFVEGPAIDERPHAVLALVSDQAIKRTDLVAKVYDVLARDHPSVELLTFGTCARPACLPGSVRHVQGPAPDELAAMYHRARVYLCTSDHEGWGLPPAEAMACGAAVVSTEIGGVMAYAQGVAAFAPPGDWTGLAEHVVRLLGDARACAAVAERGTERIRSRSLEDAADELLSALRRALRTPTDA